MSKSAQMQPRSYSCVVGQSLIQQPDCLNKGGCPPRHVIIPWEEHRASCEGSQMLGPAKPGLLMEKVHWRWLQFFFVAWMELEKASSKRGHLSWVLNKELFKKEGLEGEEHSKDKIMRKAYENGRRETGPFVALLLGTDIFVRWYLYTHPWSLPGWHWDRTWSHKAGKAALQCVLVT